MGGACSTHGTGEFLQYFGWGSLKVRDHAENLSVGWKIILEWM